MKRGSTYKIIPRPWQPDGRDYWVYCNERLVDRFRLLYEAKQCVEQGFQPTFIWTEDDRGDWVVEVAPA